MFRVICILGLPLLAVAMFCSLPAPALANPALWMVTSRSATVYLYGTVHVLPKSVNWMDDKVQQALAASSELWTEAEVGDLQEMVDAIRHYGIASPGETEALLPEEYRKRYVKQIAQIGVPPAIFAHARPWLAEILLTTGAIRKASATQPSVETTLLAFAHDHKLTTPTFETADQQFAILSDMPQSAQLSSLEDTIDEFDQAGPVFGKLVDAWQAGDEVTLDRLVNETMRARNEAVWTELIQRRNERFAERIGDRLQGAGTAFVAVGAGHLCGRDDGVPAILKNRGFTVTRIE